MGGHFSANRFTYTRAPQTPRRVARVLPCATIFATPNLPSLPIFRPVHHPKGCTPWGRAHGPGYEKSETALIGIEGNFFDYEYEYELR